MVVKEFLQLVTNNQTHLSNKEKILVNYIIKNLHQVVEMTMDELLLQCNCGYSTIYSFFRKMGFAGYRDFIISLCHEIEYNNSNNFSCKDNKVVLSEYLVLLSRINSWIDGDILTQAAQAIKNSHEIYVLGINEFDISALYAVSRFNALGWKANHLVNFNNKGFLQLKFAQKNDILLIINALQERIIIWQSCELARKLGMKIISIGANFDSSFLTDYDYGFPLAFNINEEFDWTLSANYLSSFFVIDNLIHCVNQIKCTNTYQ